MDPFHGWIERLMVSQTKAAYDQVVTLTGQHWLDNLARLEAEISAALRCVKLDQTSWSCSRLRSPCNEQTGLPEGCSYLWSRYPRGHQGGQ